MSKRVYKDEFTHEKAKEIILDSKGNHFDPVIVDAFIYLEADFRKVRKQYTDLEND